MQWLRLFMSSKLEEASTGTATGLKWSNRKGASWAIVEAGQDDQTDQWGAFGAWKAKLQRLRKL